MGNALSMRATSIGASALLVGAALIAAFTATISVQLRSNTIDPASFPFVVTPPVTPPPTHAVPPRPQLPQATEPTQTVLPSLPPPLTGPVSTDASLNEPLSGPVEISNPFWGHRPANLDRFYPQRATIRGVEGRAVLDCLVSITGALSCTVVSESPAGWGFGDAALRIAREYSMQPATRNGTPVEGHYRMNVPFTLR